MEQLATSSAMAERCARTVSSREKSCDSAAGPSFAWQAKQRRSRIGRMYAACVGGAPAHAEGDRREQEKPPDEEEGAEAGVRTAHATRGRTATGRSAFA